MNDPFVARLKALAPLQEEDASFVERLSVNRRSLPARADLINEGEPSQGTCLILAGIACRYKTFSNGKRQIVGLLLSGDLCDPYGFDVRIMDHSVASVTRIEYVSLDADTVGTMLDRPLLARALLLANLADAGTTRAWVANIGQQSAYTRTAHLLCEMYFRLDVVGLVSEGVFAFGLTQIDIADSLGLSTVHANRSLMHLREARLIDYARGTMKVHDIRKLMEVGCFQPNYLHLAEGRDGGSRLVARSSSSRRGMSV